jgi:hypothetical protein
MLYLYCQILTLIEKAMDFLWLSKYLQISVRQARISRSIESFIWGIIEEGLSLRDDSEADGRRN